MKTTKFLALMLLAVFFAMTPAYAILGIGEPPLALSTRDDSLPGQGKVLIITNASDKPIHTITVSAYNSSLDQTLKPVVVATTLEPHKTIEVGWAQVNWRFVDGETVTVGAYGFFFYIHAHVGKS